MSTSSSTSFTTSSSAANHPPASMTTSTTSNPNVSSSESTQTDSKTTTSSKTKKSRLSTYYEYNLDQMHDSKGGYLTEPSTSPDKPNAEPIVTSLANKKLVQQPPVPLDPTTNPSCDDCPSLDLDPVYKEYFRTHVCFACKKKFPEKYSLLTKTEVREDYLLTESELRDNERLPVLKKPNPNQPTYHLMWLYMRAQVEKFALDKWGSFEALDRALDQRDEDRVIKREKKFKKKLSTLRNATRTSLWYTPETTSIKETHVHEWVDEKNGEQQICKGCGAVSDVMDF